MRVVDACAGAGGKSLHLAAIMKNKGRIVAMDVEGHNLKNLRNVLAVQELIISKQGVIESSKTIRDSKMLQTVCCWMCRAQVLAF
jgi:16S rRNA (cytosine967-C5)-methyltransferase